MSSTPMTARRQLQVEIETALANGSTASEVVDLIIRSGWQPRPMPDPNSDYLEGVLANGGRVPIEIRHVMAGHRV